MTALTRRSVTVRQTGGTLVAAFDTANPPLIWKFDLERNHNFSLALRGDEGAWELGVTSEKGSFEPVAHFRARADAEDAFIKTQKALLGKKGNGWRTTAISLMVVLALLILFVVTPLVMVAHSVGAGAHQATTSSTTNQMKDGEPADADQVLKPPP